MGIIVHLCKRIPFLNTWYEIHSTLYASCMRFFVGSIQATNVNQPSVPLELYEYEGCPFCRKVREAISTLGLDVIVYPCPRETLTSYGFSEHSRFRPKVKELGGKLQFPYLVDKNTNTSMYESDAIVDYLWKTYAPSSQPPLNYLLAFSKPLDFLNSYLRVFIAALRPLPEQGMLRIPSKCPDRLLELWAYEGSPACRQVREVLASLEIPYLQRTIPFGSMQKRKEFLKKYGNKIAFWRRCVGLIQVPLLVDPNSDSEILGGDAIVKHLNKLYKTGSVSKENWMQYTTKKAVDNE